MKRVIVKLSHRAEPRGQLGVREAELDGGPGSYRPPDGRIQVASQPLGHRPEGQIADDAREMTDAAGQGPEHRQRHRRTPLTEAEHLGAGQNQQPCGHEGDRRGDVPTSVEQRRLSEGGARPFRVKHLLAASERDLPDLDLPVGDDEKAATGLTFLEEGLSSADAPHRAPRGQLPQFGHRN